MTVQQTEELAKLAGIKLNSEEIEEFAAGLDEMIAFCGAVEGFDEEDVSQRSMPADSLRKDEVEKSLPRELILHGGADGRFAVKRVVK